MDAQVIAARTRLAATPTSAAQARTFVRGALAGCPQDLVDVAVLLTSELVTNAIVHAGSVVDIILLPCATGLRVEVHDADREHLPVLREHGISAEGGRGILLVAELAIRWGAEGDGAGKSVWFEVGLEIDLRDDRQAPAAPPPGLTSPGTPP